MWVCLVPGLEDWADGQQLHGRECAASAGCHGGRTAALQEADEARAIAGSTLQQCSSSIYYSVTMECLVIDMIIILGVDIILFTGNEDDYYYCFSAQFSSTSSCICINRVHIGVPNTRS